MTPIESILGRLEKVKQRQPGQWSARCPAHADKGPSLSVRETPEGAVLVHCFAGCTPNEVAGALGIELSDLFPPRDRPFGAPKKIANLWTASQALELLASEIFFSAVALSNHQRGIVLTELDVEHLRQAAGRINLIHEQTRRHHA